jgi:hypothetical protein
VTCCSAQVNLLSHHAYLRRRQAVGSGTRRGDPGIGNILLGRIMAAGNISPMRREPDIAEWRKASQMLLFARIYRAP